MAKLYASERNGNFGKSIWFINSDEPISESEATDFARLIWGNKAAIVKNMSNGYEGRVFGVSGMPTFGPYRR